MNAGVLNLDSVQKYTKRNEAKLFDIQQNLTMATMAVVIVAENALIDERNSRVVDTQTVLKGCLDAIALLGHTSREISNRRKFNIKYSLNPQLKELCNVEKPTTKFLLGDDITKGVKDAKEMASLGKKTPQKSYTPYKAPQATKSYSYTGYIKNNKSNNGKPFLQKGRKPQQNYKKK